MSIIVTGGAGFIGSNFINSWISQSDEPVINLDKLTYSGNLNNFILPPDNKKHIFVKGDIQDHNVVTDLFSKFRPRAILNFAAESHVDRSIHGPEEFIKTNIFGTFNLLEVSKNFWNELEDKDKKRFRFLHVSTDEVYGSLELDESPFNELNQYKPNSPYSASKASSDHLVRAYNHTYDFPVLTTNCSNNYGPYQFPEKLIPLIINNALLKKSLPVYGDGNQIRDWLFVSDHCSAIITVLERGKIGEVYNIGGKNEKTNLEIVKTICKYLDKVNSIKDNQKHKSYLDLIKHVPDRPGHDRRYAIDSFKIENELKWKPKETFDTGIIKTIDWYLSNRKWTENILSGDYQDWISKHYQ